MSDNNPQSLLSEIARLTDRQRHHASALLSAAEAHARAGADLRALDHTRGEVAALLRLYLADLNQEDQARAELAQIQTLSA